ncbi:MAG: hypothetical protein U1E53_13205 [Dongiaceae bacterium]
MTRLVMCCQLVLGMLLSLAAGSPAVRAADQKPVYGTPPGQLSAASQDELDAFGTRLLTEAYSIRAKVGSPTGQLGATKDQIDPAAVQAVEDLYDDDALIQRAWLNYGLTKATYFPHDIDEFSITDVVVSRTSETVLVISFDVKLPNRTSLRSGLVMSGEIAPRLLVMRWNAAAGMWKIVTQADFDTPKAALCGADTDFRPARSHFRPEDIELAGKYLEKVQTASLTGTEKEVQSRGFQYVFASGERKTAPGKVRARMKRRIEMLNIEAIRSGDLLAVRFDAHPSLTLDGGDVRDELRPTLMTFHHDSDGEWRMIAIGLFSVTAKLAKDVPCVEPTAQ